METIDRADLYEVCDKCMTPGVLHDTQWSRKAAGDPDGPDYVVRLCQECDPPISAEESSNG